MTAPAGTILVAGVGNVFCSDDGFGPAVARRLLAEGGLPAGVEVVDAGIRGMHLAYRLLEGYTALVLVDLAPGDGPPGHLHLLEHDLTAGREAAARARFDPHGMEPDAVLDQILVLSHAVGTGQALTRVLVVGCVPAALGPGMELSGPVEAAVSEAVPAVRRVVDRLLAGVTFAPVTTGGRR